MTPVQFGCLFGLSIAAALAICYLTISTISAISYSSPSPLLLPQQLTAPQFTQHWADFRHQFGKSYRSRSEDAYRRLIFADNLNRLAEHNRHQSGRQSAAQPNPSYRQRLNRWSDRLQLEALTGQRGIPTAASLADIDPAEYRIPVAGPLPETVNWEASATAVKDQGRFCRGCWAFATVAAIECHVFRRNGTLRDLSAQNLIDCVPDAGCAGGHTADALRYLQRSDGVDGLQRYPYRGQQGDQCYYRSELRAAQVVGYKRIVEKSEYHLMEALANVGPVIINMHANWEFAAYSDGIFYSDMCDPDDLTHSILAVGYGAEAGKEYWLLKNSYGVGWGENGYVRMARNRGNNCGIASRAMYPIVAD